MILVYQRVSSAAITVNRDRKQSIGRGAVWLWGIEKEDGSADVEPFLDKCLKLRCFPKDGADDRMDLSLLDISGHILLVSQFTLCANLLKGNRPDFFGAQAPESATQLYEQGISYLRAQSGIQLVTGEFGAHMDVDIMNAGPVTFVVRRQNGRFV